MKHHQYLIVGGGLAADAAIRGIRSSEPGADIALIGAEPYRPYDRPPLSKGLWKGKHLLSIWRKTDYTDVAFYVGRSVIDVDPRRKRVVDHAGDVFAYQKLLLATGGEPRRLRLSGPVIYLRTLDDYRLLHQRAVSGAQIIVIGSGFIGCEIAAALSSVGATVTMITSERSIGAKHYPPGLSQFLLEYYRSRGVRIIPDDSVRDVISQGETASVATIRGKVLRANALVAGIGITPNVGLATSAGLAVGNGIVVDDFLRTSDPDIFAAGDVANFFSTTLNKRIRVEHEDNAETMGYTAGVNMTNQLQPYAHLSYFYSDMFDLGYEAVGELHTDHNVIEDWAEPYRKGVVYYLSGSEIRGVLLWNVWGKVADATRLIGTTVTGRPKCLSGAISAA